MTRYPVQDIEKALIRLAMEFDVTIEFSNRKERFMFGSYDFLNNHITIYNYPMELQKHEGKYKRISTLIHELAHAISNQDRIVRLFSFYRNKVRYRYDINEYYSLPDEYIAHHVQEKVNKHLKIKDNNVHSYMFTTAFSYYHKKMLAVSELMIDYIDSEMRIMESVL